MKRVMNQTKVMGTPALIKALILDKSVLFSEKQWNQTKVLDCEKYSVYRFKPKRPNGIRSVFVQVCIDGTERVRFTLG